MLIVIRRLIIFHILEKIIINENDVDLKIYYNALNKDRSKVIPWWGWKVF